METNNFFTETGAFQYAQKFIKKNVVLNTEKNKNKNKSLKIIWWEIRERRAKKTTRLGIFLFDYVAFDQKVAIGFYWFLYGAKIGAWV